MCLVSPIIAEYKSMALLGSVITKNMDCNSIYGGNPAKDITDKIGRPWKTTLTLDEKLNTAQNLVLEYTRENKKFNMEQIKIVLEYPNYLETDVTYYNITDRTYTKLNTINEIQFNKWLFKYKAKFIPK